MNILITGGKGFLGTYLVAYLKKKKLLVFTYDLYDGEDLLDKKQLEQAVKKADIVVHLAAIGDVYQVAKNPQNALTVGIVGTQNLIEAANKYSIKKIIYISTWEIYGEPQYEPIDEDHPCNPDAPYSIAKYGGELAVRSKTSTVPWIILRLGTIYGGNMRENSVFSIFIRKALAGEQILLQNGGTQKRQFTHIQDVSEAIYKAIRSKQTNYVCNVIDDYVITIQQLAERIKTFCNSSSRIDSAKARGEDPPSALLVSNRAKKLLKWHPQEKFDNALKKLIVQYETKTHHS